MWVVNKNGLIGSNDGKSNIPIMVKMIIIAITLTMGVMLLSKMALNKVDKLATTLNDKKAMPKAPIQRHAISLARITVRASLFKYIKSPSPKIRWEPNKANTPKKINSKEV